MRKCHPKVWEMLFSVGLKYTMGIDLVILDLLIQVDTKSLIL